MACSCTVSLEGPSIANACGGGSFFIFMSILEQFLRSQCDIEDSCGQITSQDKPKAEYDFIIIGGGTAGSVVANRLSEVSDWNVLLVEAGANEPTGAQVPSMFGSFFGSSIDWQYNTEPETQACLSKQDHRCYWPRAKVIGGTSVLHGMMYMRGSRKDYDNWEEMGNEGWSYKKVLPYFMKSEDNLQVNKMDKGYHGVGGYLPVSQFPYHPPLAEAILAGAKELGQEVRDVNGERHTGFAIAQTNSKNGVRYSAARAFLRPVKDRKNLDIMLNTTVARVLVDPDTKQAYGVEIIRGDGKKESIRVKKEVIVCGGSVNSPQILLLSGIGPKKDLDDVQVPVILDLPGVGKNLHNHVSFALKYYINENNTYPLNWATAMQYMLHRDGLMSGTGLSQLTGLIHSKFSNVSDDHPDIQLFFGGYLARCAKTGDISELMDGSTNNTRRSVNMNPTVLHSKSRGYLKLKDNNPLSHPIIVANYFTEQQDLETLIEGIKFALKLSKTKALQEHGFELDVSPANGCENIEFGSDKYWECAIKVNTLPENHQSGSCKMGPSTDKEAVVDPQLQVYGIKHLRVIDASVMPQVVSGNTAGPVIMIAEKGSDMIKQTWQTQ